MLYGCTFQNILLTNFLATAWSYNPHAVTWVVWALPCSLATTGGIIVYFLFLQVLRCFSSCVSLPHCGMVPLQSTGLSHSKSADQRSFAPTRSLSQLITSFIASESQGIRHVPLLTFVLPITYGRYILSAFNFTFFWSHHVKERCFNYKTIIKTEWRITDSNR